MCQKSSLTWLQNRQISSKMSKSNKNRYLNNQILKQNKENTELPKIKKTIGI